MKRAVDVLLLLTLFSISFTKLRWTVGPGEIRLAEFLAIAFVAAFVVMRFRTGDWRFPRTVQVVGVFFLLFLAVYLIGYFNLTNIASRNLWARGTISSCIHFAFLMAAIAHLVRRGQPLLWRALGWFCAGFAANALYALLALAYAEAGNGADLDAILVEPVTGNVAGVQIFGVASGFNIYRTNGLTLDPNHLGVMLLVPLLVLLPVYLRLPPRSRARIPLAIALAGFFVAMLATLSRSAILGLAVGLLILAVPYARLLLTARFLVPLAAVAGVLAVVVAQRTAFFERIVRVRTDVGSAPSQTHFDLYDLIGPALRDTPLFGLGKNTFSAYFEALTGKADWGPHSYYIAVVVETGLVGAALVAAYLVYVFLCLGVARRAADALTASGDDGAVLLRALAWGLTAALAATLVGNLFYLTMHMYYLTGLIAFALALPLVLARRAQPA